MLLDEPVSGLDPHATEEMYEMIYHLNRDHKITVIMVTHDISATLRYATKIVHMGDTPYVFDSVRDYEASDVFVRGATEDGK